MKSNQYKKSEITAVWQPYSFTFYYFMCSTLRVFSGNDKYPANSEIYKYNTIICTLYLSTLSTQALPDCINSLSYRK